MARGFFDAVADYNRQGYGAFQAQPYTPQELADMYAQGRGGGGGNPDVGAMNPQYGIGKALGGFLGSAVGGFKDARRKPTTDVEGDLQKHVMNRAFQIAKEEGVALPQAVQKAALEAGGDAAGITKAAKYRARQQEAAANMYLGARGLEGDGQKRYRPTMRQFVNEAGERIMVDVANDPIPEGFQPADSRVQGRYAAHPDKPGEYVHMQYNPATGRWDYARNAEGDYVAWNPRHGAPSININTGDRTEQQTGISIQEGLTYLQGFDAANRIMDQIESVVQQAPWAVTGLPGVITAAGANVANLAAFAADVISGISKGELTSGTPFADGKMSLGDLKNPGRYKQELNLFRKAGVDVSRVESSLIDLAFSMAIAEEKSARAISDNDIKLRLKTLASNAGSKEGFLRQFQDARERMYIKFESRYKYEPVFHREGPPGSDAHYLQKWTREALEQWRPKTNRVSEAEAAASSGGQWVRGPDGVYRKQ